MTKIEEVERGEIEINQDNLPPRNLRDSKIYGEKHLLKDKIRNFLPDIRDRRRQINTWIISTLLTFLIVMAILSSAGVEPVSPTQITDNLNTSEQVRGTIYTIVATGFILTFLAVTLVYLIIAIRNWASIKQIYILSDKYVVETYSGLPEVSEIYIEKDDIEDVEVKDSEIIFKGSENQIRINAETKDIKDIQNRIYNM